MRDQHIDVGVWRRKNSRGGKEYDSMGKFDSLNEYHGDIVLIRRLAEFYPPEYWTWNNIECITIDDIVNAVHNGIQEVSSPYEDAYKHKPFEIRNKDWHIARITYFINHPEEIRDIKIENVWEGGNILPIPVITDGLHRFIAAQYLYDCGKLTTIHCLYSGLDDVLDYLKGNIHELLKVTTKYSCVIAKQYRMNRRTQG